MACITFAPAVLLGAFERELALDRIELYGDPDRRSYAAFDLKRGSITRVWLDPRVWWRYARLLARGRRLRFVGQDTLQLGGDAVVDADGRLAWIFRSRGPDDRPSVDELLVALAGARRH